MDWKGHEHTQHIEHKDQLAPLWGQLEAVTRNSELANRLSKRGIESSKAPLFANAAQRLLDEGNLRSTPAVAFWVPGRLEVLGKHTDYAGGRSILAAVPRGFAVVVAARNDATCRFFASFALAGHRDSAIVSLVPDASQELPSGWATYPCVAACRLARNFGLKLGVDLALECDLPEASGMSSSSAVICLTYLALAARNNLASHPDFMRLLQTEEARYNYLGCIENGQDYGPELPGDAGVGTFGGSEDHTAIMGCTIGNLSLYSFCPTQLEATIPFPPSLRFVIAVSGATARKGAERLADYNNAALLAKWAAHAAMAAGSKSGERCEGTVGGEPHRFAHVIRSFAAQMGVGSSDDVVRERLLAEIEKLDDGSSYGPAGPQPPSGEGFGPGALSKRFVQFFEESQKIIPAFAAALSAGDEEALGSLAARSHALTVSHLKNTIDETEWLPEAACKLGAIGASAFGAGFGGSCWALSRAEQADELCELWRAAYVKQFPDREGAATFFSMAPSVGACAI